MTLRIVGMVAIALGSAVPTALAQSLQRLSLQGSGAVLIATRNDPDFDSKTRLGWEAQARYTFGRLSLGGGYQRSTVFAFTEGNPPPTIALSFGFLEPRLVVAARRGIALYLAGRIGIGTLVSASSDFNIEGTNMGYGGGAGLLFRVNSRFSVDLGAQYFEVRGLLPSGYAMARAGLGLGL